MTALPKKYAFAKGMNVGRAPRAAALRLIVENRKATKVSRKFPRRPNLQVLNETIPLFYICQNRHGFWVARDEAAACSCASKRRCVSHSGKARQAARSCSSTSRPNSTLRIRATVLPDRLA
jgi:hypothetical protein